MERARGAGYSLISRIQQSIVNKNTATFAAQGYSFKHKEGRTNAKGHVSKNKCALRTSGFVFFFFLANYLSRFHPVTVASNKQAAQQMNRHTGDLLYSAQSHVFEGMAQ